MNNEPVMTAAGIAAVVGAVLVLAASFGMPLTEEQRTAILTVVGALAPILLGLWARSQVTPVSKLEQVPSGPAALQQVEARNEA
jgi:hypothetical protein